MSQTLVTPGARTPQDAADAAARTLQAASRRRALITGGGFLAVGAYALWAFGLGTEGGTDAVFGMTVTGSGPKVGDLEVGARATAIAMSVVCMAAGVARVVLDASKLWRRLTTSVFVAAFVVAFLCWAVAGKQMSFAGALQNTMLAATPLILGALGGVVGERSGVVNIAIEGQFLFGAFAAALVASITDSLWAGLVAGAVAGGLVGALLAVFAVRYMVEQVVLGVVINLLVAGMTGFLYSQLLRPHGDKYNNPGVFQNHAVPGLSEIPVLGPVLLDVNAIVYLMYVLVAVVHFGLFHTRWGLRARAVGEHPTAADTVGIRVRRTRYLNVSGAGCIAGIGGAFLTIGTVGTFSKDMASGAGYIALAAVIFGRWRPLGAVAAALLFGFSKALATSLQTVQTPIPSEVLQMLPYVVTIFAVAGLVGRVRPPAAANKPYEKA
ncbi:ABC transporter permease [Yinghuangia sp. ASG 101]|uniref:ABC transporter permease n=1 Tax=Yinghuangia sp. ASG 101 TaxID=2896848 RepID=UPI001E4BE847|nr:ABC transporter permease [Yinghuangia sp. ASG 101]UGQ14467.1 ABC transporter permease [Yinghuangia sp. ASG 101]